MEVDWWIGLVFFFCRLQRGRHSRRSLSSRSRRRGRLGGLTLQSLQIFGVRSGGRCRTRCLADGRTHLLRILGGGSRRLNSRCSISTLLRPTVHPHTPSSSPNHHPQPPS